MRHHHFIDLSKNESPYGCSANVQSAIHRSLTQVHQYPGNECEQLIQKIAEIDNVSEDEIIITNGSSEALSLSLSILCDQKDQVILPQYAFRLQKYLCEMMKLKVVEVPNDGHQDLSAILSAVTQHTGLIILTNPSNPMGTYITQSELALFMERLDPAVYVLIDEAYYHYMKAIDYQSAIRLISRFSNVIVTRTFSKIYGIAGLRAGYCVANKSIINLLKAKQIPYSVNKASIIAAYNALLDETFIQSALDLHFKALDQFNLYLKANHFQFSNQFVNYVTLNLSDHYHAILSQLKLDNILVKKLDEYNLPNSIRISIGSHDEMKSLIDSFEKVI